MEINIKKCSSTKHKEINAISYCEICKLYMCNKCEILHSDLHENHSLIKINKDFSEFCSLYCSEKGHFDKLRYYCKNHNKLCCAFCLCKIKDKENGQYSNCDVCLINEIKNEKKSKLKDNIKHLEGLFNNIKESINKIKKVYEEINGKKEKLKLKIQKIFTNLRNVVNNREDELLLEIDNIYNDKFIKDELVKEIEKLPNKIKSSLEKGKMVENEWDNDNKLYSSINHCINIENNIKDINKINEIIQNYNNNIKIDITFYPKDEKEIESFLEIIKTFGNINDENLFNISQLSKIIDNNEEYANSLKKWINPNKDISCELLYRLSGHGEQFSKFHELCDNKGSLLVLYQVKDGNKIGLYTPLILSNNKRGWQNDMETFLFNLNQNKKFKKVNNYYSIFYAKELGIYTSEFGNGSSCQTMRKLVHCAGGINSYYDNGSDILPSNGKDTYYDLLEVEVFKINKL